MTISDIINPLCWDWVRAYQDNNPNPFDHPSFNPKALGSEGPSGWPGPNPKGPMPTLNPEHYIHPLTGRYSSDPFDFYR